jgi:hypothetical protein
MNRQQRKLLNLFSAALLALALYLNFFYKDNGLSNSYQELTQSIRTAN